MPKHPSAKYYQKNKERLQNNAHEKYQNLSEKEKQRFAEYRKKYQMWKNKNAS